MGLIIFLYLMAAFLWGAMASLLWYDSRTEIIEDEGLEYYQKGYWFMWAWALLWFPAIPVVYWLSKKSNLC